MAAAPTLVESDIQTSTLPRLLAGLTNDLARHRQEYPVPPLSARPLGDITTAVERSGLRGRGGAGFPTGRKLRTVADRGGRTRKPVVVVNGSEGEPASSKDAVLLTKQPHLVLDGALFAAAAVGAAEVVVCVDRNATRALRAMRAAIAERVRTEPSARIVRVAAIPHRYVAGEETALIHWLNGGEAKPTFTPPRPYEKGVNGRPTLVQNVETLAHVGLIARFGASWFRTVGPDAEPGSALVTVSGGVARPGVFEVALGTPLPDVVGAAGGLARNLQAVLVGGYFGTWVAGDQAALLTLSSESLHAIGAGIGCGVLVALPASVCGLAETARIARWLSGETAGQCGVCVNGLPAIADALGVLVQGDHGRRGEDLLHRWLGMVKGRGACKHPDGAVRLVESGMRTFAGEILRHRRRGPCLESRSSIVPLPAREGWR